MSGGYGQNFAAALGASDVMLSQGSIQNGRVDLMSPLPSMNIPAYQQRSVNNSSFVAEATYGQMLSTDLSRLFFSEENINALQDGIRYRVYVESNGKHVIGRQNDQELKIVMRSIFYQYSRNQSSDITGQVRALNAKVLEWAVPEVLSNLKQYEIYRRDASTLPMPMERGALMTEKGTKTLEIKSFL